MWTAGGSTANAGLEEFLILEFRDGVLLYVPATRIDLIQRYVGGAQAEPSLSKLGGTSWGRQKDKISEAVMDMAAEMIQIQAVRAAIPGHPYPPDSDWQREFEGAFPYQETPDQLTAIAEIRADLEKPKPMDRLLCGDVGYGKTEVAVRAAFKVIDNGRQVAILVPTTVLAEQHYKTIQQRPRGVPVPRRVPQPLQERRQAEGDDPRPEGRHHRHRRRHAPPREPGGEVQGPRPRRHRRGAALRRRGQRETPQASPH